MSVHPSVWRIRLPGHARLLPRPASHRRGRLGRRGPGGVCRLWQCLLRHVGWLRPCPLRLQQLRRVPLQRDDAGQLLQRVRGWLETPSLVVLRGLPEVPARRERVPGQPRAGLRRDECTVCRVLLRRARWKDAVAGRVEGRQSARGHPRRRQEVRRNRGAQVAQGRVLHQRHARRRAGRGCRRPDSDACGRALRAGRRQGTQGDGRRGGHCPRGVCRGSRRRPCGVQRCAFQAAAAD
mmetsp:Transcript_16844/g.49933  ORF Transcript_16844/g.49933 Transcript_16844/m.49933 type:complete len:237 (-) Transcript_16844:152-862(-)